MDLNVTNTLEQFLQAHEISTHRQGQAIVAGNMAISAAVYKQPPGNISNLLQLDINVTSTLLGERTLTESFAGLGDSEEEALKQALAKFARSSLHVLLEVFAARGSGSDQIEWEHWECSGKRWQVCLGPLFFMGFNKQPPPAEMQSGDLLDKLRDALLPTLDPRYHWLRFYYMSQAGGRVGSECLLDNAPWPQGQAIVDKREWPAGDYSIRNFMLLLPDEQS